LLEPGARRQADVQHPGRGARAGNGPREDSM
jgi:hypothetical protein